MKPPKGANLILLRAADAAVALWRSRKPIGWNIRKYANVPTVNWPSDEHFARAAAKWWLIQHPAQKGAQGKS